MILCKNCKYFRRLTGLCKHEESKYETQRTMIDGKYNYKSAEEMRKWVPICGPEASHFEPKVSFGEVCLRGINYERVQRL